MNTLKFEFHNISDELMHKFCEFFARYNVTQPDILKFDFNVLKQQAGPMQLSEAWMESEARLINVLAMTLHQIMSQEERDKVKRNDEERRRNEQDEKVIVCGSMDEAMKFVAKKIIEVHNNEVQERKKAMNN